MPDVLDAAEVAARLRISTATVRAYVRAGQIRAIVRRPLRISDAEFERVLRDGIAPLPRPTPLRLVGRHGAPSVGGVERLYQEQRAARKQAKSAR